MPIAMSDGSTYENSLDMLFAKDMPSREETQGTMPAVDMPKRLAQPNTYTPNEEDQLSNPVAPQIKDQNDPYSWGMGTAIDEKGSAKVPNPTPKFHEIMDQMDYLIDPSAIPANARPTAGELAPGLLPEAKPTQSSEKVSEPSPYGETYDKFVQHLEKATEFLNPSFIPTAEQFRDAPWKEKLGFILATSLMFAGPGLGPKKAPGAPEAPALNKDPLSFWKEGLETYDKIAFEKGIRSKLETDQVNTDMRNKMGEIQGSKEEWQKANPEGLKNWSPEEDTLLAKSIQDGKTVKEIANAADRSQAAIRGRLKALKNSDTKFSNEVRDNFGNTEVTGETGVSKAETPGDTANTNKPLYSDKFEAEMEKRLQAVEFRNQPKVDTELEGKSGITTPNKVPGKAANRNDNLQIDDPVMDAAMDKTWENFNRANKDNLPLISPEIEAKLQEMNPAGLKKLKQFETEMDYKYKQPPGRRHWLSDLTETEANKYRKLYNDIDKIRPVNPLKPLGAAVVLGADPDKTEKNKDLTQVEGAVLGGGRVAEKLGMGGTALKLYNDIVQRGRTKPITEKDFQPHELDSIRDIVLHKESRYADQDHITSLLEGEPRKKEGKIDYTDYKHINAEGLLENIQKPHNWPGLQMILGGFKYKIEGDNIVVTDKYDFNKDRGSKFDQQLPTQLETVGLSPIAIAAIVGRKRVSDESGKGVPVKIKIPIKKQED